VKRSTQKTLQKAVLLYRQKRFTALISLLEPQVFLFRENYQYYYLLGMSCLYSGDFSGADSYLQRARNLDRTTAVLLGLALVALRRRRVEDALRTYLDVLDLEPNNRRAKQALQELRKIEDPEELADWFETRKAYRYLPPRGFALPHWTGRVVLLLVLVTAGYGLYMGGIWEQIFPSAEERPGSELLLFERSDSFLSTESDRQEQRFMLTEREAQTLVREIGVAFNNGQDNLVRRELNRLDLSNTSELIRLRGEQLREYLQPPSLTTDFENYSFREVARDPDLHQNVFVRWRGRLANLLEEDEAIRFDLLVGYDQGQILEGVVPVELPFAVVLEHNQPIEVVGSLHMGERGAVMMRGTHVRVLSPSEVSR
jgi:hypothetical protein